MKKQKMIKDVVNKFLKMFNRDQHIKSMYSKLEFGNETHVESSDINADTYVNEDVAVISTFHSKIQRQISKFQ